LAYEEQPEAKTETDINRADDPQIRRANTRDFASLLNKPNQMSGCSATINPKVPHSTAIVAVPVQAIRRARSYCLRAPVRSDHRNDRCSKAKGDRLHDVSRASPHRIADSSFGAELAAIPVSTTTDKLVIEVLIKPGTPTLRISA